VCVCEVYQFDLREGLCYSGRKLH